MATVPAWLKALNARGVGMNKRYGVPDVAPPKPPVRPAAPPAPSMPSYDYTPLAPDQIDRYATQDVLLPIQAQIAALEENARRTGARGAGVIGDATTQLRNALAPLGSSLAGDFLTAISGQGALGSSLTAGLTSQGNMLATDLGQKLKAINAPDRQVTDVSGGAQTRGEGAGAAVGGLSSADLERLKGEQSANSTYGGRFPGLADLMGQENARNLGFALQSSLNDQEAQLRGQIPGLLTDARRYYTEQDQQNRDRAYSASIDRYNAQVAAANTKYERKQTAANTAYERKQAAAKAKQDAIDRQYEAAALKQAYGYPLTARDKRLLKTYGTTPEAVKTAGDAKLERQDDARARAAQAAQDRATAARQAASDARRAMLEAKKAAARSKLESDKAKYRMALERYKAAQRKALEAQKAAAATAKKAKSKVVGNAGDSADRSSGGASSYFGG